MTIEEQFFKQSLSLQAPLELDSIPKNTLPGSKLPAENSLFTTPSFWDKVENNSGYILAGTIVIISTIAFIYIRRQLTKRSIENDSINLKKADKEVRFLKEQDESSIEQTEAKFTSANSGTLPKDIESENNSVFIPQVFN